MSYFVHCIRDIQYTLYIYVSDCIMEMHETPSSLTPSQIVLVKSRFSAVETRLFDVFRLCESVTAQVCAASL